jgi:hypothetical protein
VGNTYQTLIDLLQFKLASEDFQLAERLIDDLEQLAFDQGYNEGFCDAEGNVG